MVCLNNKVPINLKTMEKVLVSELDEIMKYRLYYLNNIKKDIKEKIKSDHLML